MPEIRPFRALRYDPDVVGDLRAVVAPPYDSISPNEHRALFDRHPRNIVRLDLPHDEPGDEPDDRYRRAARTFAAWRSDGTLHKDRRPSLYVYEQVYRVPGSMVERVQRGFFGRLRLEPFGPGSGVRPHERTLGAPSEDRYRLLRASGANMSPVVGLYADPAGAASATLVRAATGRSDIDVIDDDGVRNRLWAIPDEGEGAGIVETLAGVASEGPVTIADGHHRYESALRYRDERRRTRSCEEDPAFDYLLMLFLDSAQQLTVLPTQRVVRGLDAETAGRLGDVARRLFSVVPVERDDLIARFSAPALPEGGRGRFGLWTRRGGFLLEARRDAFEPMLPPGNAAARGLDVMLLEVALADLLGIDAAAVAPGGLACASSAAEALDRVDAGTDDAGAVFLLEPTPVTSIVEVSAAGEALPPKSTCFYPRALSGLLINPLEW